jgi:hypothetical protein
MIVDKAIRKTDLVKIEVFKKSKLLIDTQHINNSTKFFDCQSIWLHFR